MTYDTALVVLVRRVPRWFAIRVRSAKKVTNQQFDSQFVDSTPRLVWWARPRWRLRSLLGFSARGVAIYVSDEAHGHDRIVAGLVGAAPTASAFLLGNRQRFVAMSTRGVNKQNRRRKREGAP